MTLPWWLVALYGAALACLAYLAGARGWDPYGWLRSRLRRRRPSGPPLDLVSFDGIIREMYALPGTRLKQWVVDMRRETKWERETAPRFAMPIHLDNTGADCREAGIEAPWHFLEGHDCCSTCNEAAEGQRSNPAVIAWLAERAARPLVEPDHSKMSDEVEPEWQFKPNPMFAMLRRSS